MQILDDPVSCNKILIVDDDPEELFATSRILQKSGYLIEEATSGEETLEKAGQFKPDLILLDVVMPGIDGFETCRRIKSDRELHESFVVLMSSLKKTPDYKTQGLDAGADGFIPRPIHNREFVSRIGSIMRIKSVEKELRTQRQWLRVTLSSIGDGLIATDENGRVLFMNPVAEQITGWTVVEAHMRDIREIFNIIDETTRQPVKGPIGRVLKEGMIIQLDDNVLLIRKNKQRIPIADSASPIRKDDGQIIGGVLVFRDVTEKKQAEEKTVQAMRDWGSMFKAIGQMTLIIDPQHGILDANDVALEKTGLTREQIVGKKCFDIIHGQTEPVENCPMVKSMRSKRQETSALMIQEIDGDYLVSCTPVLNALGDVEKIIHIATDISELKHVKKELSESERKYHTLFDSTYDAVLLVDVETMKIIDANKSAIKMYGYSREEFMELVATDISAEKNDTMKAIQVDSTTEIPIRHHRRKDGSIFPVEITQTFLTLNNRKVVLGSIRDISRRLEYEKERYTLETHLRHAQKMEAIGTLSSGIAHDFNNILSSVIGFAELSLDTVEKGTMLEDNLQEIYSAGKRAKDLIKQILSFARQEEEAFKPVIITPIVEEAEKLLRSSLPANIDIRCNLHCDDAVFADPSQIHQVVMNLCTNAAQAMEHKGGKLEISLMKTTLDEKHTSPFIQSQVGNHVIIRISDSGTGIPKPDLESIFEPYFTTKAPGEGTGLGLSIVHGIIKRHGGHIDVQSEVGIGTVFEIYLPVTDKPSGKKPYASKELPTGGEHILFIDDERPIAKMSAQILERLGYSVSVSTSSLEALERFRSKPGEFDVVITDLTMPNMTGDVLAAELIAIRPEIPVILCTGYSRQMSDEKASKIGIKAFAYKPIVKADLAETIRRVLDEAKSGN